ncbi:hypothetical protein MTP99_000582 [Tenebrio molitor]|jgi:hypothetical protein|nr:hypothetical protein MTP99_000582 [Tenebrio molitor]
MRSSQINKPVNGFQTNGHGRSVPKKQQLKKLKTPEINKRNGGIVVSRKVSNCDHLDRIRTLPGVALVVPFWKICCRQNIVGLGPGAPKWEALHYRVAIILSVNPTRQRHNLE